MYKKTITLLACLLASSAFAIDMDAIVGKLGSDDFSSRQSARLELKQSLAEATAPGMTADELRAIEAGVIAQLDGKLPLSERLYLIRMLEVFGTADSAQSLYPLLGDAEPEVRDSARRALAVIPGEAATGYLIAGLSRGAVEQRASYIDALVYRGTTSAAPEISKLLQSRDEVLVRAAALALGQLGDKAVVADLLAARDAVSSDQKLFIEAALLDLGVDSDTAYMLAGQGSNVAIRAGAFEQLCAQDVTRATAVLTAILSKPEIEGADRFLAEAMRHEDTQAFLANALPTSIQDDQLVVVVAIGEMGLSQYESQLIALAEGQSGDFHIALIDALSRIGSDASFKLVYDAFQANPRDSMLAAAVARLPAPKADQQSLETVKNGSDMNERVTAMKILELRNVEGATGCLNGIASQPGDVKVREAAIKSLEVIGDLETIRIFVELIVSQDEQARAAQRSLKRLAQNLDAADTIWKQVFVPALESASSDDAREGLMLIMDAVACEAALAYLRGFAIDPNATLHTSALRTLERWPNATSGEVWLDVASTSGMPEKTISTAEKTLKKWLSKNDRGMEGQLVDLAVLVLKECPSPEFKLAILEVYEQPPSRQKRRIKSAFKQFANDPDIGATVQQILSSL
ncbi:MAG: HEAT repeat domain-containing protein [Opitutaceae bacterium]